MTQQTIKQIRNKIAKQEEKFKQLRQELRTAQKESVFKCNCGTCYKLGSINLIKEERYDTYDDEHYFNYYFACLICNKIYNKCTIETLFDKNDFPFGITSDLVNEIIDSESKEGKSILKPINDAEITAQKKFEHELKLEQARKLLKAAGEL